MYKFAFLDKYDKGDLKQLNHYSTDFKCESIFTRKIEQLSKKMFIFVNRVYLQL